MKYQFTILRLILALASPVMAEDAGEVVNSDMKAAIEAAVQQANNEGFQSCAGASAPIRVVFDITRGIQSAKVYEGSKLVHQYRISGGRNRPESNDSEGKVCAYTSVGVMKPLQLIKNRKSKAHNNADMPFYVELDAERAVGAHAGDISGYSGGCIRQSAQEAKWLYQYVQSHSQMDGGKVVCSDVTFQVVDNTPGVAEARAACFAKIGQEDPVRNFELDSIIRPRPRPADLGNLTSLY